MSDEQKTVTATSNDRFHEAVAAFEEARDVGANPSLAEWQAKYPDVADQLADYIRAQQRLQAALQMETVKRDDQGSAAGTRIGPYTLVQLLAEGGMGSVWVAKQTEPVKRKVALKLIKAGMDSKAVVNRFEHERQALAVMDHPNIARVFDGGITADGRLFFVMELVNGLPLSKFCDEARLTPRQRLDLFLPICQAVQHAHQKGIVHRDLKPSNILVTLYDGKPVPKVIDFGVAKALAGKLTDESLSTQFGAAVGTLEYMAPEQAGVSALDIDTRADIYSLGVILYELLTGLRPIDGKRLRDAAFQEMIHIIHEEEPPRPSTRFSTEVSMPSLAALRQMEPRRLTEMLRGELDWIVMKCLEKSRERRYETANALARDVQRYLADEAVEARPPSFGYRAGKVFRRHKGTVFTVAVVVLALMGGIIGTTWGMLEAIQQEGIAAKAAADSKKAAEDSKKAEESEAAAKVNEACAKQDALAKLWGAYLSEANARRYSGRPGQRFESLKAIREALKIPFPEGRSRDELRNLAVASLALPDINKAAKTWDGWPEGSSGLDFDPVALKRYARGDLKGNVTVRRMDDDTEEARLLGNGEPRTILFGVDGKTLLLIDPKSGSVKRWKIGTAAPENVLTISNAADVVRWEQSRDGRRLLVMHSTPTTIRAEVLDLVTGRVCFDHSLPSQRDYWISHNRTSMSPDGCWLARGAGAYGSADCKDVLLFNLETGKPAERLSLPDYAFSPVWHPDSRTLAVSGWNSGQVFVWDVPSRKPLHTLREQKGGGTVLSMGSSGQLMTGSGTWGEGTVFWHPHTGKSLLRSPQSYHSRGKLQDGRIFTCERKNTQISVHIVEPSPILRILVPSPMTRGECRAVEFHKDGRLLAVGHHNGVSLFDLTTGIEIGQLPLGYNLYAKFDPSNGDLLTYGMRGLYRWPVQINRDSPEIIVGPPRLLGPGSKRGDAQIDISGDGKMIVVANYSEAVIYREEDQGMRTIRLAPLTDARAVRISRDGRWVFTRQHEVWEYLTWDAQTGRQVRKIPSGEIIPDTNWLMSGRQLWSIATGEKGPLLPITQGPSPLAFSSDGTVFAGIQSDEAVHLVDAKTGKTLVQLGLPEQSRSYHASFSPDGTQLVHQSSDHHYVYVWDLRALRRHLAEMGLDWDGPPNFSEEKMRIARSPYTLRVNAGVLADNIKK